MNSHIVASFHHKYSNLICYNKSGPIKINTKSIEVIIKKTQYVCSVKFIEEI